MGHTLFCKKISLIIVSIQRKFYQNRFITECARKKKLKSRSPEVFLVIFRRTCVLNNLILTELLQLIFYDGIDALHREVILLQNNL